MRRWNRSLCSGLKKRALLTKFEANDLHLNRGVTTYWKSVHRISGYQAYQPDIRGIINWYQEKIDQSSIEYLTDLGRIFKNVCWIYINISQISVDKDQSVKNLKNRWIQPCFDRIQQADIKAFYTSDIMSCHPLILTLFRSTSCPKCKRILRRSFAREKAERNR